MKDDSCCYCSFHYFTTTFIKIHKLFSYSNGNFKFDFTHIYILLSVLLIGTHTSPSASFSALVASMKDSGQVKKRGKWGRITQKVNVNVAFHYLFQSQTSSLYFPFLNLLRGILFLIEVESLWAPAAWWDAPLGPKAGSMTEHICRRLPMMDQAVNSQRRCVVDCKKCRQAWLLYFCISRHPIHVCIVNMYFSLFTYRIFSSYILDTCILDVRLAAALSSVSIMWILCIF